MAWNVIHHKSQFPLILEYPTTFSITRFVSNISTPKRRISWFICFLCTQVYKFTFWVAFLCVFIRVTIIYVVDIWKGWNDEQCWRQVQNHQTHQNSYEFLQSDQIRLHKIYQINSLYHYISMLYFPHYFPFFISIFSSFLFLFVLWWYYTRSGTIKRLRIRKCIKRNWDTIIHSKCFIFSKIRSDKAHYPTTTFISSTLLILKCTFYIIIWHYQYFILNISIHQ